MNKEKVTEKDKQELAKLTTQLISKFNQFVHTKDVSTFDLRDIRKLIKKDCDHFEIETFHNAFTQMWKVWPDT